MKKLFKTSIFSIIFVLGFLFSAHHVEASTYKFFPMTLAEWDLNNSDEMFVRFSIYNGSVITYSGIAPFHVGSVTTSAQLKTAMETAMLNYANVDNSYDMTSSDIIWNYEPNLSTVGKTGMFSDIASKPTTLSGYGITDGVTSGTLSTALAGKMNVPSGTSLQYVRGDGVLETMPTAGKVYEGTTQRTGFPIFKSATVSGGTAVFHLTNDGTSGGTALFPNGVIQDSVNAFVSDAAASYQMSYAFSNSNKTLTVTANKLTTANILTGILGQTSANGATVRLSVWGY